MRKHFAMTLLFSVFFMTGQLTAQNLVDAANFKKYAANNEEILSELVQGPRIVFLGNSITENWVSYHGEFFTRNNYIGRGISGQSSYNFLLRFREDVIDLNPDLVIINVGTNDVAENSGPYDEDITMNNLMSMVELAQVHNIKVILTSVLPAAQFGWRTSITDAPEKIVKLNSRIKQYAKDKGLQYVDYYKNMISKDGRSMITEYTKDGVHPTLDGYLVMEEMIQKAIKKEIN